MPLHIDPTSIIRDNVSFDREVYVGPYCDVGGPGYQHGSWVSSDFVSPELRGLIIGRGARILGSSVICMGTSVGENLRCDHNSYVGEDCTIGSRVVIEYGARLYDRCIIADDVVIGGFVCNDARIGSHSVIQGSLVHSRTRPPSERPPTVGSGVLIGRGAVVVGEVLVGDGALIAAGAVLVHDAEPGFLYAGVPAKRKRLARWF